MGASHSHAHIDRSAAQSIAVGTKAPGESAIHRHASFPDRLVSRIFAEVGTLYESFNRTVDKSPESRFLGTRTGAGYTWMSYGTAAGVAREIGAGLRALGIASKAKVGIHSLNRAEWALFAQGCNRHTITTVPLYDTLGPDAVGFIVAQAELPLIAVSANHVDALIKLKEQGKIPSLQWMVQWEEVSDEVVAQAQAQDITLLSLAQLRAKGVAAPIEAEPPAPEDLATICYTSGTTGDPKGVMVTHANVIADAAGTILTGVEVRPTDIHISYLPLAHMFERTVQEGLIMYGAAIGFFQGDILKLMDDVATLRPTIFCSVPRLFNKMYDKITAGVAAKGGIAKALFDQGFAAKQASLRDGWYTHALWDTLVFGKIAARLGGRVRIMITGSAPVSPEVLDFLRICFSCPVFEGYGQTETGAASNVTAIWDTTVGHVGPPLPCNEIKLVDVPDMGYTADDKPHPRGEVCFRGPNITAGYFKNEAKTAEAIDKDGWLHSGDIGLWLPNGTLKIIDRKKDIFKLAQGEYVAAAKIENIYNKCPLVAQSFVYGDSLKSALVAIVVPDFDVLVPYVRNKLGIAETDPEVLCSMDAVRAAVHDEMLTMGKSSKLHGFEQAKAIRLFGELFSAENNLLTPTFKLKRPQAKKRFQPELDDAYAELEAKGKA